MKKQYQFGHTKVGLILPEDMPIPQNMQLFACQSENVQKVYTLQFEDDLEKIVEVFLKENPETKTITRNNMKILSTQNKECRVLKFEGDAAPYAVYVEQEEARVNTYVSSRIKEMLQYDAVFGSLLGLEKLMVAQNALILHSAYMCRSGKAILFSAPSETGKSTQAALWEKYRGTKTINGDRSLLICEEEGWSAYGWPICGSSEICHNEHYPIEAIVMLYQAKENKIRRLNLLESMKKLMSQITINMWNTEFQMRAMDLIQQLAEGIPVYELGCDMSENAVKCLEEMLEENA